MRLSFRTARLLKRVLQAMIENVVGSEPYLNSRSPEPKRGPHRDRPRSRAWPARPRGFAAGRLCRSGQRKSRSSVTRRSDQRRYQEPANRLHSGRWGSAPTGWLTPMLLGLAAIAVAVLSRRFLSRRSRGTGTNRSTCGRPRRSVTALRRATRGFPTSPSLARPGRGIVLVVCGLVQVVCGAFAYQRVVGVCIEAHAVGVERQAGPSVQHQVVFGQGDVALAEQAYPSRGPYVGHSGCNRRRINGLWQLALEAEDDRPVAAVPVTGGAERADNSAAPGSPRPARHRRRTRSRRSEQPTSARLCASWTADADREQIEHADGHATIIRSLREYGGW